MLVRVVLSSVGGVGLDMLMALMRSLGVDVAVSGLALLFNGKGLWSSYVAGFIFVCYLRIVGES